MLDCTLILFLEQNNTLFLGEREKSYSHITNDMGKCHMISIGNSLRMHEKHLRHRYQLSSEYF
uniref:Uncharacterized protein n=1 Tax=Nelumbo nucifera TaxID=4432 RepID=A0A822ZAQ8_NELNU|nr:TPA_asm: hypothetical protein HUJ06_014449 [Nelumbo nucifera]